MSGTPFRPPPAAREAWRAYLRLSAGKRDCFDLQRTADADQARGRQPSLAGRLRLQELLAEQARHAREFGRLAVALARADPAAHAALLAGVQQHAEAELAEQQPPAETAAH